MNSVIENYLNSICCGATPPPACGATVITVAAALQPGTNNVVLSWTAIGAISYDVYVDNAFRQNVAGLSYTVLDIANNDAHTYNIVPHCATGVGPSKGGSFTFEKTCMCPPGYTKNSAGDCIKEESTPAMVSNPGYCLAESINEVYTSFGSRIYGSPFQNDALEADYSTAVGGAIIAKMGNSQWQGFNGPMNREAVWIDSDCDGNRDALSNGTQATIAYMHNNAGAARTVYIGIGADNHFVLKINGSNVADSKAAATTAGTPFSSNPFKIWHIIPVLMPPGLSYFNAVATGDGSVNDAIAMVIYDNTAAQITAATSDSQLNVLFHSGALRGTTYDVATCALGWSLDTSGGPGNYVCRRTLTTQCA